jgi:hypothetical protein
MYASAHRMHLSVCVRTGAAGVGFYCVYHYAYVSLYACMYACMHGCASVCMSACIDSRLCAWVCICVSACGRTLAIHARDRQMCIPM